MNKLFECLVWCSLVFGFRSLFRTDTALIEIAASAAPYVGLGLLAEAALVIVRRRNFSQLIRYAGVPLLLAFSAIRAAQSIDYIFPRDIPAMNCAKPLRVFYANVLTSNSNVEGLRRMLRRENPDLVALLELNRRWHDSLDLAATYPHQAVVTRSDNFGIGLYSKLPFAAAPRTASADGLPPLITATVEAAPHAALNIAVIHTMPPLSKRAVTGDRTLRSLVEAFGNADPSVPLLVAGDLNATVFSHTQRDFVRSLQLTDPWEFAGWHRTWNAFNPVERFTLDYIFSRNLQLAAPIKRLEFFGSDHFPLLGSYCFPESE